MASSTDSKFENTPIVSTKNHIASISTSTPTNMINTKTNNNASTFFSVTSTQTILTPTTVLDTTSSTRKILSIIVNSTKVLLKTSSIKNNYFQASSNKVIKNIANNSKISIILLFFSISISIIKNN